MSCGGDTQVPALVMAVTADTTDGKSRHGEEPKALFSQKEVEVETNVEREHRVRPFADLCSL